MIRNNPAGRPESIETFSIHHCGMKDDTFNSVVTPIYTTSTFAFSGPMTTKGYDYSRTANPTRTALEETLAALEGGALASATATGMAAVATTMHLFGKGDHIITGDDIYGGTYRLFASILPTMGIEVSFVNMRDLENIKKAIRPTTRAIWIETPSNPLLNLVDIEAISELAHNHKILSIVDNTFMSPYFQKPLALGADIVMHSTTKYINGHSDVVGGAIISKDVELGQKIAFLNNAMGSCCSPFDAWLVLRGLRTLAIRMEAHQKNAMALAEFLVEHPKVSKVYYPGLKSHRQYELALKQMTGFGGMLSFEIKGGQQAAFDFVSKLKYFAFAESLGGVESLICHPATMTHLSMDAEARVKAGITESTIRVSAGIENADDLLADFANALG